MPKLLFALNSVPDDEAEDVRALLGDHDIDVYETTSGRWGFGVAAIWLVDETQFEEVRLLIDEYQIDRCRRSQLEFRELNERGEHLGFIENVVRQPLKVLFVVIGVCLIFGITIYPFLNLIIK